MSSSSSTKKSSSSFSSAEKSSSSSSTTTTTTTATTPRRNFSPPPSSTTTVPSKVWKQNGAPEGGTTGRYLHTWQEHLTNKEGEKFKTGRWSPEEDQLLRNAYEEYLQKHNLHLNENDRLRLVTDSVKGTDIQNCWLEIASVFRYRTVRAVMRRAVRLYHPHNYQGKWSKSDKEQLISLVQKHGKQWKRIAEILQRTPHGCANEYALLVPLIKKKTEKTKKKKRKNTEEDSDSSSSSSSSSDNNAATIVAKRSSRKVWSSMEEKNLTKYVLKFSRRSAHGTIEDISWQAVANAIGNNRTPSQCVSKWVHSSSALLGLAWDKYSDKRLVMNVINDGGESMDEITWSTVLPPRAGADCRSRFVALTKQIPGANTLPFLDLLDRLEEIYKNNDSEPEEDNENDSDRSSSSSSSGSSSSTSSSSDNDDNEIMLYSEDDSGSEISVMEEESSSNRNRTVLTSTSSSNLQRVSKTPLQTESKKRQRSPSVSSESSSSLSSSSSSSSSSSTSSSSRSVSSSSSSSVEIEDETVIAGVLASLPNHRSVDRSVSSSSSSDDSSSVSSSSSSESSSSSSSAVSPRKLSGKNIRSTTKATNGKRNTTTNSTGVPSSFTKNNQKSSSTVLRTKDSSDASSVTSLSSASSSSSLSSSKGSIPSVTSDGWVNRSNKTKVGRYQTKTKTKTNTGRGGRTRGGRRK